MRRPSLWGLALALPLLASPWLEAADAQWRVWFFQGRGAHPLSAARGPVLLAVDGESLALEQLLTPAERQASPLWRQMGPWPWPRALQAELAAAVLERGAAQVVFNVVLAQPSRYGRADDQAFERRLAPWRRRVVLAASLAVREESGLTQQDLQRPLYGGFPRVGLTALLQSPQGVTEAIPGSRWQQEALADFPPPHPPPLAWAALDRAAPPQPLAINYPGPAGSLIQVPAWQVLQQPEGFWRGRTVLLGPRRRSWVISRRRLSGRRVAPRCSWRRWRACCRARRSAPCRWPWRSWCCWAGGWCCWCSCDGAARLPPRPRSALRPPARACCWRG